MRSERHDLRRSERVRVVSMINGQGVVSSQGGQVECGQSVKNDNFVCRVGVDGLVQRESHV